MNKFDHVAEKEHIDEMMKEYRRLPRSCRAARRRLVFKIELAMYNYDIATTLKIVCQPASRSLFKQCLDSSEMRCRYDQP